MKRKIPTLALLLAVIAASAQPNNAVPKNIRASNTLDNLFDANGLSTSDNLFGIPLEPGRVVGNAYLNPDWKRTTLLLYDTDKMIEGCLARYEISSNEFEIKVGPAVKVLNGKKVKSFVWLDSLTKAPHYFVNAKDYSTEDGVALSGFYEVLSEGNLTLLTKTQVVVKEPNYNQALDMGQRDTRIEKKTEFYYLQASAVRELPASKKKLLPLFGPHAGEIGNFVKVNRLSLNDPGHLRAIFERYNALTVTN